MINGADAIEWSRDWSSLHYTWWMLQHFRLGRCDCSHSACASDLIANARRDRFAFPMHLTRTKCSPLSPCQYFSPVTPSIATLLLFLASAYIQHCPRSVVDDGERLDLFVVFPCIATISPVLSPHTAIVAMQAKPSEWFVDEPRHGCSFSTLEVDHVTKVHSDFCRTGSLPIVARLLNPNESRYSTLDKWVSLLSSVPVSCKVGSQLWWICPATGVLPVDAFCSKVLLVRDPLDSHWCKCIPWQICSLGW